MSTKNKYTRTAMALHWLVAVLMIVNVALALSVDYVSDESIRPLIDNHKSIGILVLGLFILRLLWRIAHRPPELPASFSPFEKKGAHWAHIALYALMLLLPLSGWLHDSAWKDAATHPMELFHLVPWPRIAFITHIEPQFKETLHDVFGNIHEWLGDALYILFSLHVLGALKHEWIDKESVLSRMLPWGKN
ncbi:MAG TPA: cytochrome b/b6 domain-containing protein [Rhodocyclaceae bacterium]|nr:cytochrome b/b6 domain-containing protein [Rhodocyclaceae bacterium]